MIIEYGIMRSVVHPVHSAEAWGSAVRRVDEWWSEWARTCAMRKCDALC